MIAWTYFVDVRFGYSKDLNESIIKAITIAEKAKQLNPSLLEVYSLWNAIYFIQGQYDQAIDAGMGKSRLVENFKATLNLEEIQWIEGHAYAYAQNIPYFPLIDFLNRVMQIDEIVIKNPRL
jgi:hypothetical protein